MINIVRLIGKDPVNNLYLELGINNYAYLKHLRYNIYNDICTESNPTPWPNLEKTGKNPKQYWFGTKSLISLTKLYKSWYKIKENKKKNQKTKSVFYKA